MKVMLTAVFVLASLCATAQDSPKASDFKKLNWLVGDWTRTNSKPGRGGMERWNKTSDRLLTGQGFNLKGTDTLFVENIKLVVQGDEIFYVADVKENPQPVYFKLTHLTESSFTCENAKHDFPKKLNYTLAGKNLTAVISGDGKSIEYLFTKK